MTSRDEPHSPAPLLHTVEEVAEICHASPRTVRRWMDERRLVETRLGRRRLVAHRDLLTFLAWSRRKKCDL